MLKLVEGIYVKACRFFILWVYDAKQLFTPKPFSVWYSNMAWLAVPFADWDATKWRAKIQFFDSHWKVTTTTIELAVSGDGFRFPEERINLKLTEKSSKQEWNLKSSTNQKLGSEKGSKQCHDWHLRRALSALRNWP